MRTPYHLATAARDALAAHATACGDALTSIPGVGSLPDGRTPDAVRATPRYREAAAAYQAAHDALRTFNATYCKAYSREIRADRDARRAAKLAA